MPLYAALVGLAPGGGSIMDGITEQEALAAFCKLWDGINDKRQLTEAERAELLAVLGAYEDDGPSEVSSA